MEPTVETKEVIVPDDSSASGDWGSDALEYEQQLANLPQTDDTETPDADGTEQVTDGTDTPAPAAATVTPTEPVQAPVFDINGKLRVEAGKPLTAEQVKELERGCLRERDYTQKTQQIAEVRREAEGVIQAAQRINSEPRALREYFPDQHIISAFTPQEMLNYGLAAAKVTPQIWNQFLDWYKDAGMMPQGEEVARANPYHNEFGQINQQISTIDKTVRQLLAEKEQAAVTSQEQAQAAEMQKMDSEVGQVSEKFGITKEELLMEIVRSKDESATLEQLAKAVKDRYETRFNDYVKTKTKTNNNAPKPVLNKGKTVNIVRRAPKTFAEANQLVSEIYGDGALKTRS